MLEALPAGLIAFPGSGISANLADKARKIGIPVWRFIPHPAAPRATVWDRESGVPDADAVGSRLLRRYGCGLGQGRLPRHYRQSTSARSAVYSNRHRHSLRDPAQVVLKKSSMTAIRLIVRRDGYLFAHFPGAITTGRRATR
jgi:hypothetical protein